MWYDVLVVAILVFFTIRGAARGMIWQLAGIAGIVLCFAFADGISAALGPSVSLDPPLNHWVVLFVAYLGFSFLSFGVARALTEWIEKAQMKEFNSHLGAVCGLLKGGVLCLILTFLIVTVSEEARVALKNSHSGRYAAIIMDRLHPILPDKLHEALEEYIHLLDSPELKLKYSGHPHSGDDHSGHAHGEDSAAGTQPVLGESTTIPQPSTTLASQPEPSQPGPSPPEPSQPGPSQPGPSQPGPSPPASSPSDPAPAAPPSSTLAQRRTTLIRAIASLYSTIPTIRQGIELQIAQAVAGLPQHVEVAVLEDWKADLYAERPDPDPGTNMHTPVEERIVRQLERAGVPLGQLSLQLQQRLRSAAAEAGNPL